MNTNIAYFGYGSLVNLGSLRTPYISAHRVTLKGWKRIWLSHPREPGSFAALDGLAFLSVVAAPETEIDGMLITDHASSLDSLDQRESLYSRVNLQAQDLKFHDATIDSADRFLYVADEQPAHSDAKILRSYLDVVMQGYFTHFGHEGLENFFATTENFALDILEDRKDPIYPRATHLSPEERDLFSKFR